jgi:hypothetical protein
METAVHSSAFVRAVTASRRFPLLDKGEATEPDE